MVQIQINLPDKISKYLSIKKETCQAKDKKEMILIILEEKYSKDKDIMKIIKSSGVKP